MNAYLRAFYLVLVIFLIACTQSTTIGKAVGSDADAPRVYRQGYDTVFNSAVNAAGALGWQVMFTDQQTGVIAAETATSLLTWGDKISIKLTKQSDESTRVDVSSGTQHQIVDWGSNSGNIADFFVKLDEIIAQHT